MENIAHTLVGAVVGRAGLDRLTPRGMPTLLIAANLPDIDIVSAFGGGLAYLDHHRGITHSFAGILCEAPLLAGAILLIDRRSQRNGAPARFLPLLFVALCGLLSHLLLDWTNSYGVRPWLPFDASWVYGDLVFIVDPTLWLILGGALWLSATDRSALAGALLATGIMTVAVLRVALVPPAFKVFWCAVVATLLLARWYGASPRRLAANAGLLLLLLYWGGLSLAHTRAERLATASAPEGAVSVLPDFADPLHWRAYAATADALYVRDVSLLGETQRANWQTIARGLTQPAVQRAEATYPGRVLCGFGRFLVAQVTVGAAGRATVVLSDLRFAQPGRPSFATARIPVDGPSGSASAVR